MMRELPWNTLTCFYDSFEHKGGNTMGEYKGGINC